MKPPRIKQLSLLELYFLVLVIALSFTPLLRLEGKWDGLGPYGTYIYNSPTYQVRFNDFNTGTGKPEIYVWDTPYFKVPFIELSDQASYIDGCIIHEEYNATYRVEDNALIVHYKSAQREFTKTISVDGSSVTITLNLDRPSNLTLAFWRYYLDTAGPVNKYTLPVQEIPVSRNLSFTFVSEDRAYHGELRFSATPQSLTAEMDEEGINKVAASFNLDSLTVEVTLIEVEGALPVKRLLLGSALTYPIAALLFSAIYLGVRLYGPRVKVRFTRSRR